MTEWLMVLVGLVAVAFGALGGWPLTVAVLGWAARSGDAGEQVDQKPDDGRPSAAESTNLRGGTWIGLLERAAIVACLAAGYPSGIAVVVAVKGLGRYPELREHPDSSERFVIGTLTSMIWAGAVGALARHLITR